YHRQSIFHGGKYLSSHALMDFIESPALFHDKIAGLMPDRDSDAYRNGRAAHCRILEGPEAYRRRYVFGGPVNEKTGGYYGQQTKAYGEWRAAREAEGLEVLPDSTDRLCELMAAGVAMHPEATETLQIGEPEATVRAPYCGTPCQIRIDWLTEQAIVDLKTCRSLKRFAWDFYEYRYQNQFSFYQKVYENASSRRLPVLIIAVEKEMPCHAAMFKIEQAALDKAQLENEAAIERMRQCQATGNWPTGYEGVHAIAAR
ncbi:MAG: PD-(D/E)XK nuclease-like domain-containing protein, partial [Planctomycetota bacterium]|nr:PD-(D/E)XK nuclease-like domain-containing protein [Planctomycetota bacterium]